VQEKAILETRPVLHKAIEDVYTLLSARRNTMIVADLGCSSGPNTLLVVSEVMGAIRAFTRKQSEERRGVEVQFFLNDLPGNDFNLVFRSLEHYDYLGGGKEAPPYYVAGLPGSYYRKLFPCRSVHLIHSSYSLMWRSKVHMHAYLACPAT
jgi:jasmonate O-methyltransferase